MRGRWTWKATWKRHRRHERLASCGPGRGVLAGTAAAVAGGVVYAERRDDSPEQPEFYGVHQAGIATLRRPGLKLSHWT